MRIKNNIERIVSLFLCFLMVFSSVTPVLISVYADPSANERNASFINFYQNSDETILDMKNLSNQDYYAMLMFMSNWFEPGKTTLKELTNPDMSDGSAFKSFATALRKTGSNGEAKLKDIVKGFGEDTLNGIASGAGTITDSAGNIITGKQFLEQIVSIIETQSSSVKEVSGTNSSKKTDTHTAKVPKIADKDSSIYFNGGSSLAFDLSEDVVRAAFQTALAYNPDLFLTKNGLESCKALFLDAVGNVWGYTGDLGVKKVGVKQALNITTSSADKLYLILPACLNPSGFTPNVTNKKSQEELRMPLMNRFVLSSMVTGTNDDSIANFQNWYIPIYNLLANYNQQQLLTVIGLKTLSPYTLNTDDIYSNTWSKEERNRDLASTLYNYKEIGINKSKSTRGIASVDSYAYIAFCMNIGYLKNTGSAEGEIDLKTGFWQIFGCADYAFDVLDKDLEKQKKLITYFFTPTMLSLDKVSMNFYRYTAEDTQETFEEQWGEFFANKDSDSDTEGKIYEIDKIATTGLASTDITKMGLAGMGLFIEDIAVYSHKAGTDNEDANVYVTPSQLVPSRFVRELVADKGGFNPESNPMDYDMYKGIKNGTYTLTEQNHIMLRKFFLDGANKNYKIVPGEDEFLPYDVHFYDYNSDGTVGMVKRYIFNDALDIYAGKVKEAFKKEIGGNLGKWVGDIAANYLYALDEILGGLNLDIGPYHFTKWFFDFRFHITWDGFDCGVEVGLGLMVMSSMLQEDGNGNPKAGSAFVDSMPFTLIQELKFGQSPTSATGFEIFAPEFKAAIKGIDIGFIYIDASSLTNYIKLSPEAALEERYEKTQQNKKDADGNDVKDSNGNVIKEDKDATSTVKCDVHQIEKYINFNPEISTTKLYYYIGPSTDTIVNVGTGNDDITLGSLLGFNDSKLREKISLATNNLANYIGYGMTVETKDALDLAIALYGYSVMYPSYGLDIVGVPGDVNLSVMGNTPTMNPKSTMRMSPLGENYLMGIYLGYIVDMMGMGVGSADNSKVNFGAFYSPFLPKYTISAKGGNMSLSNMDANSISGVEKSEDLSFEQKQKDLIDRIYGLTNDSSNDYRNNWFKNIIEGLFLTFHRTITGTWGTSISSVTTGTTSTYQSVTGYIYTPTLEELSFTATLMNNYIKIYVICLMLVIFFLILMVLLHIRTWQQGVIMGVIMSVALLFPYILISNTINISNKISDSVYSDRFDFWAITEHQRGRSKLVGSQYMNDKDLWLVEGAVTADTTTAGAAGVKIKWMSPKKVDIFQNLYSDSDLSESFVTNIEIFKWLFNSFIYDCEFVDTDVFGSYVYRSYNSIALEAESYYAWGQELKSKGVVDGTMAPYTYTHIDNKGVSHTDTYNVPVGLKNVLETLGGSRSDVVKDLSYAIGKSDSSYFTVDSKKGTNFITTQDKLDDVNLVSQYDPDNKDLEASLIGLWGLMNDEINLNLTDPNAMSNVTNPGIVSNLPESSSAIGEFDGKEVSEISKAIYLKNTESPYYYFYSVLKTRYGSADLNGNTTFKRALLTQDLFKVSNEDISLLKTKPSESPKNEFKDFLDLEGLFTYVIPYMKATNKYIEEWQEANYSEIEEFNFIYEVDEDGNVIEDTVGQEEGKDVHSVDVSKAEYAGERSAYLEAVKRKNNLNRVWNMYCPWVESLYDLDVDSYRITHAGKNKDIYDALNPSSYYEIGRPMIFSPAEMNVRGYRYKDLTDIERKMQAVLENTYTDLLYLVNYYDMDDDVVLSAAAMYATFHFNAEFSENNFLSESVMLYPQGFELKNFNYDAFMRLALLNATGENVFGDNDLYERVLSKTNIFTGLLLVICDLVACVIIPMFKFLMILGLLFLGLLVCITCVINPPEKIFEMVNKSVLLPTCLFMVLNVGFAIVMSFVIGEGLTAYVGSKTVNLSTNDPTITMLVMAGLGIVYTFFAWKILKILIEAYKKFGLSTALAAVGIVGSAISGGAQKIAQKASKISGGIGGAVVGAATAGKGNRLAGAFEGGSSGAKGVINQRIRDRRNQRMLENATGKNNDELTNKLNKLSKTTGDGSGEGLGGGSSSSSTKSKSSTTVSRGKSDISGTVAPDNRTPEEKAAADKKREELQAKLKRRQQLREARDDDYYAKLERKYGAKIDGKEGEKVKVKPKKSSNQKSNVNTSLKDKRNTDRQHNNGNRNNSNRKTTRTKATPARSGSSNSRSNSTRNNNSRSGNQRQGNRPNVQSRRSSGHSGSSRRTDRSYSTNRSHSNGGSSNRRSN